MYKAGLILLMAIAILSFSTCNETEEKETETATDDVIVTKNFDWLLGNR